MADPFASNQPTPPSDPRGGRPRAAAITIVVLAVVAALAIAGLIWALVAANGTTPTPTPSPAPTASSPAPTQTSASSTPAATSSTGFGTCAIGDLHVTLGTASGAAGSTTMPVYFTNTGSDPCELHGFPGVSFVGDGNGTQLGAAADEDQSVPITRHILKPGDSAHALLKIVQAGNVAGCTTKTADGLRIYPPHSYDAAFVKASGLTACTNKDAHLLTVQPVTTG